MKRFLLKTLFIHFLVVLLVDGHGSAVSSFLIKSAFAEGGDAQERMQHLYSTYAGLKGRTKNNVPDVEGITNELMSDRGKQMLDQTQAFIADPANRTVLATPEGAELISMHNRFARMRKVKGQLDNCFTGDNADLAKHNMMLPERIFTSAFMTPEGSVPCDPRIFSTESLDNLFGAVGPIVNNSSNRDRVDTLNKLQADISDKNMENAVQSYVALKYTYSGKDISKGAPLTDRALTSIVNSVCMADQAGVSKRSSARNNCTSSQRSKLIEVAKKKQQTLMGDNAPTFTHRQAADNLREQFTSLNSKLMRDDFRFEVDYKWKNEIDRDHPKSKRAIANYTREYSSILSGHPGMLAMTNSIAESVGSNRESDGALLGIFGTGGANLDTASFRPHPVRDLETDRTCTIYGRRSSREVNCGAHQIGLAVAEAEQKILDQAKSSSKAKRQIATDMADYKADAWTADPRYYDPAEYVPRREADLVDLVKRNPTSVGQVLMSDPSLTDEACLIMRKVAEEQKDEADGSWIRTALLVGGLALGAIALVGIGALIIGGIGLLAGAATAGATVAWGGATLTSLALPGLVYGVVESTDAAVRWNQARQDRDALASAYLAGGGDQQTRAQFDQAVEEANNAAWELGLALGFTVLDAPAVIGVARLMDGAQSMKYLQDVSRMFNHIESSRKLRTLFRGIKGSMNLADFRTVMKQITKLDGGLDFIKRIEDMELDQARALFSKAHEICVRSCL